MRIHLIKEKTIWDFTTRHARSFSSLNEWVNKLHLADWKKPEDMNATFPSADVLGKSSNRVVFDIGGNSYRVICKYLFGEKEVHLFIKWIGTHAEYTKLCNKNEQYHINIYFILWKPLLNTK